MVRPALPEQRLLLPESSPDRTKLLPSKCDELGERRVDDPIPSGADAHAEVDVLVVVSEDLVEAAQFLERAAARGEDRPGDGGELPDDVRRPTVADTSSRAAL